MHTRSLEQVIAPLRDMLPQYIVKPSRSRLSGFAWHRDSAWCRGSDVEYHPYLSIWVALDDAHAGALVVFATLVRLCTRLVLCSQVAVGGLQAVCRDKFPCSDFGTALAHMHFKALASRLCFARAGNGALLVRPSSGAADVLVEVQAGTAVSPMLQPCMRIIMMSQATGWI